MEWLKDILLNLSRPWHDSEHHGKDHGEAHETDIAEDYELIAVITAAVAASLDRTTNQVVVRSIRRVPSVAPVWNKAGRHEQAVLKL